MSAMDYLVPLLVILMTALSGYQLGHLRGRMEERAARTTRTIRPVYGDGSYDGGLLHLEPGAYCDGNTWGIREVQP